jgi:hypothetical protein
VLEGKPGTDNLTATFRARDRLTDLTGWYSKGQYTPEGNTLYSLAMAVLEDADIPLMAEGKKPYILDDRLKNIVTKAPLPKAAHKELLQLIAHAACMVVFTDRDGYIHMEPASSTVHDCDIGFDTITSEVVTTKIPPVAAVQVDVNKYAPAAEEKELHREKYVKGSYTAELDFAHDIRVENYQSFTVRAKNDAGYDDQEFSIAVLDKAAPEITTDKLPGAQVGETYAQTIKTCGGLPTRFWVSAGTLPQGLRLDNSGNITGMPTQPVYGIFTISCANAAGSAETQYTVIVDPASPPSFGSSSLPPAAIGVEYEAALEVKGIGPVTVRLQSGEDNLPPGLVMDAQGRITGTPTETGSFSFTVEAVNIEGADSKKISLKVDEEPSVPQIKTSTLPKGTVGEEYSAFVEATGTPGIVYAIDEGYLPGGLDFNGFTGKIWNTPTHEINQTVTVVALHKSGNIVDYSRQTKKKFTLTVGPMEAPKISTKKAPTPVKGQPYAYKIEASGSPAEFSILLGALPKGLTLSSDGTISGTPSTTGVESVGGTSGVVEFTSTVAGDISIKGRPLEVVTEPVTAAGKGDGEVELVENPLITDTAAAMKLAAHTRDYLMKRATCEFTYRGQPEIDCLDMLRTQSMYDPVFVSRVLKHTINFNGALTGEITVKRMVSE